jgi:hypothetical protein
MKNTELSALCGDVVLRSPPQQQIADFLLSRAPTFRAPTDAAKWRREIPRLRAAALSRVFLRGWPREVVQRKPRIVWGEILRPDPSYVIRKLRFEAFPDYWVPALLYEPLHCKGKLPAVLNPNGHHAGGKAVIYKQIRCANLARRGVLALNFEFIGMSELAGDLFHTNIGLLDLAGRAGVGVFYLAMRKALDVLLAHPRVDRKRVAMTGLSGGGWQTIVLSALDPRINLSVPVAGYTAFRNRIKHMGDAGDGEQMPPDLEAVLDYQRMTAMLAPRPALLILNAKDDCCFVADRTKPVIYDAVRPTYRAFKALDRFAFHVNHDPGTHNYDSDNRTQFYRFINRHFGLSLPTVDTHRPEEILAESRLNVGLPLNQTSVLTFARKCAREAVSRLRLPRTAGEKAQLRRKLAQVIRLPRYGKPSAQTTGRRKGNPLIRLRVGPWSLPMVWARDKSVRAAWLIVSDRPEYADPGAALRIKGNRFFLDVLGTGACRVSPMRFLQLQAIGERLLGIQAAQILAAARFVAETARMPRICLSGNGTCSALACLVAAALEPSRFRRVAVTWEYSTLVHVSDRGMRFEEAPSQYCADLLTVADIPQMVALLDDVEYVQPGRCVRTETGTNP